MTKKAILFAVSLMAVGVGFVVYFGLQPRPVRMIKPSYAGSAAEVGFHVWRRLRHVVKDEPAVFFGVQDYSDEQYRLVQGFLAAAQGEGKSFENWAKEVRLANDQVNGQAEKKRPWNNLDTRNQFPQMVELSNQASLFFLLPSVFTSRVIADTPVERVEKQLGKKFTTISIVRLALNSGDLPNLHPKCYPDGILGYENSSALGCVAKRKSTGLFRKRMDDKRFVFAMDQQATKDYLIYFHSPGG